MSERPKMTIDDIEAFRTEVTAHYHKLVEFFPLIRKKHEKWTAQAFEDAVKGLGHTCGEFIDRLSELAEAQANVSKLRVVEKE